MCVLLYAYAGIQSLIVKLKFNIFVNKDADVMRFFIFLFQEPKSESTK